MTRYARAGKGTHQRVAKDPTPWDDMKPSKPERVRGAKNNDKKGKRPFNKNGKKERFSKGPGKFSQPNANLVPVYAENRTKPGEQDEGSKNFKNSNIRGYGQSKSVKIFGQFWVPMEEGKRLNNLVKKLKDQGLGRKEILEALKNEIRKAEKAAKRQRDKTCFQCRQFGHILSDCPKLRQASSIGGDLAEGNGEELIQGISDQGLVCFKCGSTEHTSRNCRRKGENFEFAKCFVCSGTGHIARQCPKNENGIYPSGGSCGECGSITHLKKDCPDLFGADVNANASQDNDAVTLRISDPFSSTEYEPVFDFEKDSKKDKDEGTFHSNEDVNNSVNPTIPTPEVEAFKDTSFKNKSKKRKQNFDANTKVSMLQPAYLTGVNVSESSVAKPGLFSSKKRKIVKF